MLKTETTPQAVPRWSLPSRTMRGWLIGVAATFCFSASTPLLRQAYLMKMNPDNFLLARLWLTFVCFALYVVVVHPAALRVERRHLIPLLGVGALSGASTLAYNWSLTRLNASLAVMIFALNPIVTLAFLMMGGERLTARHWFRLVFALLGVYWLVGPGGEANWMGVGLVLLCILFWSLQMVAVQWWLTGQNATTISFYSSLGSAIVMAFWWLAQAVTWSVPNPQIWLILLVVVIVATVLSRLFFYHAIQILGSGQMSLLMPIETMLSVLWAATFLHERFTLAQGFGAILILISMLLAIQRVERASSTQES